MATIGTDNGESITTGNGNDTIFARGGGDVVFAGGGGDLVFGQSGGDFLNGVGGNDSLFGGSGNDLAEGIGGDDVLAVEVGFSNFGTDVLEGNDGFDTIVFKTGFIIEVNGTPSQFTITDSNHGVLVNLVNQFAPGTVKDFDLSLIDANGELAVTLDAPRGTILDSTSVGSGAFGPNGVLDVIDDPSAVFEDIEEFDLTNFADYFFDSAASHSIEGGGGNDFISGGLGTDLIDGGSGSDTAVYRNSTSGVSISLLDFGNGGSGSGGEAQGDSLFSVENVSGSNFDDVVIGNGAANVLRGFGGRDSFFGGNAGDTLVGGDGNDRLTGGAGADDLEGGNDSDTLDGGSANDQLDGASGRDTAVFQSWNSVSIGGFVHGAITLATGSTAGSAVLSRTFLAVPPVTTEIERDDLRSIENVVASDFSESIVGNSAANTLEGRGGGDVISGGQNADALLGGDGNDRLIGGSGSGLLTGPGLSPDIDLLEGGNGIDTADYSGNVGLVIVTLGQGSADGHTTEFVPISPFNPIQVSGSSDTLRSIENVIGSGFGDVIAGNGGDNSLSGGAGNDTITGAAGADRLAGGNGADRFGFGAGDVVAGERISGGDGLDVLILNDAGAVNFALATLNDVEIVSFFSGTSTAIFTADQIGTAAVGIVGGNVATLDSIVVNGASIDLAGMIFSGWTADDIISLNGTAAADTITGSSQNDSASGADGADTVDGAAGDDTLAGGLGADSLDGGDGSDTASYTEKSEAVAVTLNGAAIATVSVGGLAEDTVVNIENVIGGSSGDTLTGDSLANRLAGGDGADTLGGGGDNDIINCGAGNDSAIGGGGLDTLTGGVGDDTVKGGVGNDSYLFALGDETDRIVDGGGTADELVVGSFADIVSSVRVNNDLVLTFVDNSEVTVVNHFLDANRVENVVDATGQVVVLAAGTIGGDASGIISGASGPDYLNGNGGDEILARVATGNPQLADVLLI